ELAGRGHEVVVVFDEGVPSGPAASVLADIPRAVVVPSDLRRRSAATAARRVLDYLRYLDPPYASAALPRRRALGAVPQPARAVVYAAVRRPAGRTLVDRSAKIVDAVAPTPRSVRRLLKAHRPDAVIVSPLVELGSPQTAYVRAARAAGIASVLVVASWDNL